MPLQVYDSMTRRKVVFEPADPGRVTMYACGPTVYSHPHIGNARPAVVFDLLHRVLARRYPVVVYARNITDIEDKINAAAQAEGVSIGVITDRYSAVYHRDMEALGVGSPTIEPRATDHVPQMIEMIGALIERGNAYEADGHVLFNVPSFAEYGRLSRQDRDHIIEGARVEVAPYKRDPADFVLWKPSPPDVPGWQSPWGRGRPGWHIECSVMAAVHLGRTIDIHAGGADLVFPHHENEIAQSTCAHGGEVFSRYWMHNGYVNIRHEKMSKSLGNILLVRDLLAQAPGEAVRVALLAAHYRKPLEWNDETLPQAARRLDRLYAALGELDGVDPEGDPDAAIPAALVEALEDDLNTPVALSALSDLGRRAHAAADDGERARVKAALLGAGRLLGVLVHDPAEWARLRRGVVDDAAEVERLVAARGEARARRDWQEADRIRDALAADGIVLEDGPRGTTWRRAESQTAGG